MEITEYADYCIFCGRPMTEQHHLLNGPDRKKADEDGLIVPLCSGCHTMNEPLRCLHRNPMAMKLSKMLGQMAYEKNKVAAGYSEEEAREMFRKRYGKSYF